MENSRIVIFDPSQGLLGLASGDKAVLNMSNGIDIEILGEFIKPLPECVAQQLLSIIVINQEL